MSVGRVSDANAYTRETVEATDRPVPAKVFIGGPPSSDSSFRVPVGGEQGVHVEYTKNGPAAINRQATVSFPTEAFGVDWLQKITNETTPEFNIGAYDPATVQLYDSVTDQYVTALYGFVADIGANGKSVGGRFRVFGPEFLLSTIPANAFFNTEAVTRDVLTEVVDTLETEQALFDEIAVADVSAPDDIDVDGLLDPFDALVETIDSLNPVNTEKGLEQEKRFKPNRDTLADVITWVQQTAGARVWFVPTPTRDGPNARLFAAAEPSVGVIAGQHLGGPLPLADADVIPDDRGVNTVRFVGKTGLGDQYPVVTASAPDLVAAQGQPLTKQLSVDIKRTPNLVNYARSEFKEIIDQTNDGSELVTPLAPSLQPYAGVQTAVDVREARDSPNPRTITVEIERVSHRAYHDASEGVVSRSTASTSRYVRLSDIAVEQTTRSVSP